MTVMTINNELTMQYPDGFREMGAEETERFFTSARNRQSIYDEERHILISVAWTKPGFLNRLTNVKTILYQAEGGMKNGLQDYRRVDFYQSRIDGRKTRGICFEFTAHGSEIAQCGELAVIDAGDKFYALTFVAREEGIKESRAVFREIAQSLTFIKNR